MTTIKAKTRRIRGLLITVEEELKKSDPDLEWIKSRLSHANDTVNEIDGKLDVVVHALRCLDLET